MVGEGVFMNFVNSSRDDIFAKFVKRRYRKTTQKRKIQNSIKRYNEDSREY